MFKDKDLRSLQVFLVLFALLIFFFGLSIGTNFYLVYKTDSLERQLDTSRMETVAERNNVYLLEEYIGEELLD